MGTLSPGPCCSCRLCFLSSIHTPGLRLGSWKCTLWLSSHLGHPRSNFTKVVSGPSRTAQMLWLLSCLQLGPAYSSMAWVHACPASLQALTLTDICGFVLYFQFTISCLWDTDIKASGIPRRKQVSNGPLTPYLSHLRCDFDFLSPSVFLCWWRWDSCLLRRG